MPKRLCLVVSSRSVRREPEKLYIKILHVSQFLPPYFIGRSVIWMMLTCDGDLLPTAKFLVRFHKVSQWFPKGLRMLIFCYAFDVCSWARQTSRTTMWRHGKRLYHAVLGTTDGRRRQAHHRLRCRETRAWLWQMDKVCVAVKYIHITC